MRVTAAKGLARILKAEGVSWVSTFPTCNVNNALGQEGVPLVMMRDERYAVALADAFSRVTGGKKIGVCTVMGGLNPAGLQMAYGALAQAYEDNSPMLCITDGMPVGMGGALHYEIAAAFKSVTKWIGEIDQPQRVPELMRRAFTALRSGRPRPVLITLPRGLGEYDEDEHPYAPVKGWRSGPDPADVQAAVGALASAKHPLIYVGEGIYYAAASPGAATDQLLRLAELAQIPVLTSLKAKSAFPENHPLSVGVRGELASDFLCRCDVLLAIGASLLPGHFGHLIPDCGHKTIIHCTVDEQDANRTYPTSHVLLGDAGLSLCALIDEYAAQAWGEGRPTGPHKNEALLGEIRTAREQLRSKYGPLLESNEVPINPYRVYGDLMKVLDPHNSFVTPDSGNTRDQTSTVWEALIPRGYMGWGNVSTLGFGLAAAMAAKLAYPQRQCVNITGDAGVGYMLGNLEALVRHQIGVTTVHINNGCFAGYGPGFWGPGHDPYTSQVSEHAVADMSEAVKALGYHAEHVTEPGEIIPALERALAENAQGRPAYVEFICSQYPVFGAWVTATSAGH
jgi:acetolactate synthase-1/2/3 large subunit